MERTSLSDGQIEMVRTAVGEMLNFWMKEVETKKLPWTQNQMAKEQVTSWQKLLDNINNLDDESNAGSMLNRERDITTTRTGAYMNRQDLYGNILCTLLAREGVRNDWALKEAERLYAAACEFLDAEPSK